MKTIPVLTAVAVVGLIATSLIVPPDRLVVGLLLTVSALAHSMALMMWVGLMSLAGWIAFHFLSHGADHHAPTPV